LAVRRAHDTNHVGKALVLLRRLHAKPALDLINGAANDGGDLLFHLLPAAIDANVRMGSLDDVARRLLAVAAGHLRAHLIHLRQLRIELGLDLRLGRLDGNELRVRPQLGQRHLLEQLRRGQEGIDLAALPLEHPGEVGVAAPRPAVAGEDLHRSQSVGALRGVLHGRAARGTARRPRHGSGKQPVGGYLQRGRLHPVIDRIGHRNLLASRSRACR